VPCEALTSRWLRWPERLRRVTPAVNVEMVCDQNDGLAFLESESCQIFQTEKRNHGDGLSRSGRWTWRQPAAVETSHEEVAGRFARTRSRNGPRVPAHRDRQEGGGPAPSPRGVAFGYRPGTPEGNWDRVAAV